jgi:hypothetical protein
VGGPHHKGTASYKMMCRSLDLQAFACDIELLGCVKGGGECVE